MDWAVEGEGGSERERFHNGAVRVWGTWLLVPQSNALGPSMLGGDHSTRGLASCDRSALFGVDLRR